LTSTGPEEHFGHLFAHADDQPAHNRSGNRGEAAQDHHWKSLQCDLGQRELHAKLRSPDHAGNQRDEAGDGPDDHPDVIKRNTDGLRCLMVVRDRAQRPAGGGLLEKQHKAGHQGRGHEGGDEVFLVHKDAALEDLVEDHHRLLGDAKIDLVDIAAPDRLAEAVEKVGDAQCRHQQGDPFLIDQRPQHQAFDQPCEDHHDHGWQAGWPPKAAFARPGAPRPARRTGPSRPARN
jgi:hypothetical protein